MKVKGEYYVEYDNSVNAYCVFHTDLGEGKAYASFISKEEAEQHASNLNGFKRQGIYVALKAELKELDQWSRRLPTDDIAELNMMLLDFKLEVCKRFNIV